MQTLRAEPNASVPQNPLGCKPVGRLLVTFSLPAIVSCLINSIYNIVDQIFIGQGVGYLGNAATTVAFPVMTILLAFSTLIGAGSSAHAAIRLEKNEEEAERTLNTAFSFSILLSVVLMVLGLLFLRPLLRAFGATDSILPYALDYTSIILLGTPFNMVSVVLSNLARTDGHPRMSMYGMMIGAFLNTILDPIYIFVLHWGVKGAAIATITSQIISAVVLTLYFLRPSRGNPRHMRLRRAYRRPDWYLVRRAMALGVSSGITQSVGCIMQVVMNNSLVHYGDQSAIGGDVALSAMGIVMKIAMIMAAFGIGVGIGAQPILGFNRGAKNFARIRRTYLLAVTFATGLIAFCWLLCQLFPETIVGIFGKENAAFTDFAVKCLRIYLFSIFCAGFQIVSTNYFQATGQPLKASVLSMLRQLLLLIPLILILPLFFGLDGILYSAPIADAASAAIVAFFIVPEMRRLRQQIGQMPPAEA